MRQAHHRLRVSTEGKELYEITDAVTAWLSQQGAASGLLTVFCRHTSASLLIQENADPDVRADLARFFERLAPEHGDYIHDAEGPDDMPAHIRAALTATQLAIPLVSGRLVLGTWQGIYLFEHRAAPHVREIALHFIGGLAPRFALIADADTQQCEQVLGNGLFKHASIGLPQRRADHALTRDSRSKGGVASNDERDIDGLVRRQFAFGIRQQCIFIDPPHRDWPQQFPR